MGNKIVKGIFMKIDHDLYTKSKSIIPDRTKDYEDYLRRRISIENRGELIKVEIEELDARRVALMKEYDLEMELQGHLDHLEKNVEEVAQICLDIIENLGYIGLDRLKIIAELNGVGFADLKNSIPEEFHHKFVKYHLDLKSEICNQINI